MAAMLTSLFNSSMWKTGLTTQFAINESWNECEHVIVFWSACRALKADAYGFSRFAPRFV